MLRWATPPTPEICVCRSPTSRKAILSSRLRKHRRRFLPTIRNNILGGQQFSARDEAPGFSEPRLRNRSSAGCFYASRNHRLAISAINRGLNIVFRHSTDSAQQKYRRLRVPNGLPSRHFYQRRQSLRANLGQHGGIALVGGFQQSV